MEIAIVKNALGSLERLMGQATQVLRDIEYEEFGESDQGDPPGFADPRAALKAFLAELHDVLLVVLEAADMPETRASLIEAWKGFKAGSGLDHIHSYEEFQQCESPPLTFLEHLIQGLRIAGGEGISSEEAWTLQRLDLMLRDTAGLVHRREKPANEIALQKIMHDYLSACFTDFTDKPQIAGTIKNFKPDCGIRKVHAAIEFKFVRTKAEVATIFSGIAEDTAGYKSSKDWTQFYAVIYQAEAFALASHLQEELKRIGADTWTVIAVNGPTGSKTKKKKE